MELNSSDTQKFDPSNPSESKVDPLDTLSAGQRAALEILKNKNLIVSQKEADKALRKHKRDTVNMGCLKCPLSDVNGAAPQYTLERLHTKRHARKSDDEHIIMIVYSAPANDQDFIAKAANKMIEDWTSEYLTVDNVYITPVVKCVSAKDPITTTHKCCDRFLREELLTIQPDVILCLGKAAAAPFNLKGKVTELYNRIYDVAPIEEIDFTTGEQTGKKSRPAKLIVTYSPAHFMDDYKLRSSVEAAFGQANRIANGGKIIPPDRYYLIESAEEFGKWVDRHLKDPRLNNLVHAFDIETNGRELHPKTRFDAQFKPKLRCVSYSWGNGVAICVPFEDDPEGYYPYLKRFHESDIKFIGHNVAFDYFFLRIVNKIWTRNIVGDTMLMASMLNPGKGKYGYGLKPLSAQYTDLGGYETDMKGTPDDVDPENPKHILRTKWEKVSMDVMAPYNCADADATLQIYKIFIKRITDRKMLVAHWIMTHALIPLGEMEHNGFLVDRKWVDESRAKIETILEGYKQELRDLGNGRDYDWNSPKEVGIFLYEIMKYPIPQLDPWASDLREEDDKSEYPTGDAALSIINTPLTQALRKYRKASKLLSTYFNGYLMNTGLDGCLRADFNLVGTITGRLSSSGDANLQNIPSGMAKTAPGYEELHEFKLKKAFIARPGWKIINADQSQLELRIAGACSYEDKFINSYKNKIDMHSRNAKVSFSLDIPTKQWEDEALAKGMKRGTEEFDVYVERAVCKHIKHNYPDERQAAKSVSFGILYGMSKWGLASDLNAKGRDAGSTKIWTPEECGELIARFKEGYPTLIKWQNGLVKFAKKNMYTYTCFGRRRYLPMINSEDYKERGKSARHALNTPVQSAGSDFMMMGVINMHKRLDPEKMRFLATVHDSVVCEVREDYIEEFVRIAKDCLERPRINGKVAPLCDIMPFIAEFEIGDSYGTLEEYAT